MATEVIRISRNDKPVIRADKDAQKLLASKPDEELINKWFLGTEKRYTPAERDAIVATLKEKKLFPDNWMHERERSSGLYPDIQDPTFGAQLYRKQEFYETRAVAIASLEGTDPCSAAAEGVFEVSPTQRLVSRFLNPATPYNGLLLFHGVGVGKTCSAVRVAEEYLKVYPTSKVFIVVPQAISAGFRRTIFDIGRLKRDGNQWISNQCTGMTYPDLAMAELLRKTKKGADFSIEEMSDVIDKKVRERYFRFGYLQFANWIMKQLKAVPSHLTGEERTKAENDMLSKLFSDKLVIIDEAHNLRDVGFGSSAAMVAASNNSGGDGDGEEDDPAVAAEDRAGGKKLTPLIKRIVKFAEGMRLLLMSATPMYNKASEIAHLLNLLIVNDTKDDSPKGLLNDIFAKDGTLKKGGDVMIRAYSQRYVSYMRGENPYTFPLRLRPSTSKPMSWPTTQKIGEKEKPIALSKEVKDIIDALPIVHITPKKDSPMETRLVKVLSEAKEDDFKADTWVHLDICNIVYPNGLYGHSGWDSYFEDVQMAAEGMRYRSFNWRPEDDDVANVDAIFSRANLASCAPKMSAVLDKLQNSTGINFIYSRYVKAGILPLAIAMEREGWTRVFSSAEGHPLYTGRDARVPRQCALCSRKENNHAASGHEFTPACYILLTGDFLLTPNFADSLNYATRWPSTDLMAPYGSKVKAILGSQITTEGLDLKCIRSIHILDPWYHLNRIEQIIGRGIRFCSHSDLPTHLRNCLIYMYALSLVNVETPDLHAYRISAGKARAIGNIQREMKIAAMDCNLNIQGLVIRGAPPRRIVDSEGNVIEQYNIDDKKYSSTCDYMDQCVYECSPPAKAEEEKNSKTYTYNDAQKRLAEREHRLKQVFSQEDVAFPIEMIRKTIYGDMPWEIVSRALTHILESPAFEIKRADGLRGRLILQNGYLIFQPTGVRSRQIPLAYRYAKAYAVLPRRSFQPRRGTILGMPEVSKVTTEEEAKPKAEAGPVSDPIAAFNTWLTDVDKALNLSKSGDKAVIKLWNPQTTNLQAKAWGWLLFHFRGVPEIRKAAAQYFVDSIWKSNDRRAVLEKIIREGRGGMKAEMLEALDKDLFTLTEIAGFKWVNSTSFELESYCLNEAAFDVCPSSYEPIIATKMGKAVDVKAGCGDIFGFYVPRKDGTLVFKSLDKTSSKRILGAVGADCSVASDLGGHRGRVRQIQTLIKSTSSDLAKLVIQDEDSDVARNTKGRAGRQADFDFKHIDDLSHIQVCAYMETLLRLMDYKKYRGDRWFLNAVEASRAGLKGR